MGVNPARCTCSSSRNHIHPCARSGSIGAPLAWPRRASRTVGFNQIRAKNAIARHTLSSSPLRLFCLILFVNLITTQVRRVSTTQQQQQQQQQDDQANGAVRESLMASGDESEAEPSHGAADHHRHDSQQRFERHLAPGESGGSAQSAGVTYVKIGKWLRKGLCQSCVCV